METDDGRDHLTQDDEPFIRVVSAGIAEDHYDYKGDFENSIDYDDYGKF